MTTTPLLPYPDACDCHMHVYEDQYALAPNATFKPPHAPASDYREVQALLGLARVVVVQPTGYGFDNSCTLNALQQLGPGARGIAVIPPDIPDDELQRLHDAGIRGVRFMMLPGGVLPWSDLPVMAARVAPLGWNINLQLDGRELPAHEADLLALPCRLVIDHIGKFLGPVDASSPSFQSLCRLLDTGNCWIKISAPYESSRVGAPGYEDVAALAQFLAFSYPKRCLWASNWPHPNVIPTPSNPEMLNWALERVADQGTQHAMLVDNPAELYGF